MKKLLILILICVSGYADSFSWTQVLPNVSSATSRPFVSQFSDGSAVAIWTESSSLVLKGAYFNPATKAWGTAVTITTSTGEISDYSIKTNDSDFALGVWLQTSLLGNPGEAWGVQYTKSTNTWTTISAIFSADSGTPYEQPSVNFTGNNLALFSATNDFIPESLVFWENFKFYNYSSRTLLSNRVLDTLHNQFNSKTIGKTGTSQAISVSIQCDVNDNTNYKIGAALVTSQTTVNSITTISAVGVDNAIAEAVGSNLNGQAVVAWVQGGTVYTSYLTSFASNTWSSPVTLNSASSVTTSPLCAMDNSGNAVVAWLATSSGTSVVQAAFFSAATNTWSSTTNVSLLTSSATGPSVAASPSGLFGFTWTQGGQLLSRFYQAGTWMPALTSAGTQIPGSTSGTLSNVTLCDAIPVRGVCVWQGSSVDSAYLIYLTLLSPTGQQVLFRYPVQGDLVNQLRWSPNPNGVTYQVYRNDLTQLIAETTQTYYDDHQRQPNQTVTYYIRSISPSGIDNGDLASVTVPPIHFSHPKQ